MNAAGIVFKVLAGLVMFAVMAVVVRACIVASDQVGRSQGPVRPKAKEPALPPITVTTEQMKADYDENEVAAEAKYKGRVLHVSAVVSAIDKDFTGQIVLRLRLGKRSEVSAFLDKRDADLAASLKRGDDVDLACAAGMRILGKPTLRECRIR